MFIFEEEKKKIKYENVVDTLGGFDDEPVENKKDNENSEEDKLIVEEDNEEISETSEKTVVEKSIDDKKNIEDLSPTEEDEKIKELKSIMEALLLVEKDGLKIRRISHVLKVPYFKVKKYMYELMDEYNSKDGGIIIKREKRGFVLVTNPKLSEHMKEFIQVKDISLSRVAYETLAIIALNQPITKMEIERIRGIASADSMLSKLRSKKLIRIMGRKSTVGKPRLYGVGMMFFKHFGIRSLKELKEYSKQLIELGSLPVDEEKLETTVNYSADLLPENDMGEIVIAGPDNVELEEKNYDETNFEDEEFEDNNGYEDVESNTELKEDEFVFDG